jgi:hypothetical protein
MPEKIIMCWFVLLMALAIIWLALILWIFHRLRHRHIATYESIGSPSLFCNNSMRNNWLFFKFLFGGQWRDLGDRALSVFARCMQAIFVVYVCGFLAFFAVTMLIGIRRA